MSSKMSNINDFYGIISEYVHYLLNKIDYLFYLNENRYRMFSYHIGNYTTNINVKDKN